MKKILGVVDGINTIFKTFEYRRVTNFTTATFPLGLYLNGTAIPLGNIIQDDLESGTFQLQAPSLPSNTSKLTGTYYYKWFDDSELDQFLQNASSWLGYGTSYVNLDDGLNAAALRFAAQEAYEKAAAKYSTRASQVFQLEDAPTEDIMKSIEAFKEMSEGFLEKAETMRDDFYKRQGQPLAPLFGFALGRVTDPTPRR
jgi:hypothetical protein